MQKGRAPGICPNCEHRRGEVGEPCPEPICQGKGYHFIPDNWYRSAKESAKRTRKPLDPLLGRTLDRDRYLLIGKLGEGGMGVVYLALQRPLDREVALKLISKLISGAPGLAQFEGEQQAIQTAIERFKREAKAIAQLNHPNIVKLHDFGVAKLSGDDKIELPFMALEYVKDGRTLKRAFAEMRKERGGAPIPGDIVLAIFSQILNALAEAHKAGIIHRDMKPENVMVAPVEGNPYFVKVLDFGLAKAVGELTGVAGTLTRPNQFLGTPFYMAPEQAPHSGEVRHVDDRADLYAVAIMLYEVFTGVLPFDGGSALEINAKKVDPTYDPLSLKEAQGLPRVLREFLRKGMAKDPEARFANASEMLKALEAALTGHVTSALGFVASTHSSSQERPKTPGSGPSESARASPEEARAGETEEESVVETKPIESSEVLASRSWFRSKWVLGIVVLLVIVFLGGAFWFLGRSRGESEVRDYIPETRKVELSAGARTELKTDFKPVVDLSRFVEFQVNTWTTGDQRNPSITSLRNGGFVVVWESGDGSGYGIYGQMFDSNGHKVGSEFRVNTWTTNEQRNPSITSLSNGRFVVVWESDGQDGSGRSIYAQRFDFNGKKIGSEFRVNTETKRLDEDPVVTSLPDGGFMVVWRHIIPVGFPCRFNGQRFSFIGNKVDSEFWVTTWREDWPENPRMSSLSNGGFVVVWTTKSWRACAWQDGSGYGVCGQMFDSNGTKVRSKFLVNTWTTYDQAKPSIASLPNGGFVVVWESGCWGRGCTPQAHIPPLFFQFFCII